MLYALVCLEPGRGPRILGVYTESGLSYAEGIARQLTLDVQWISGRIMYTVIPVESYNE